MPACLPLSLPSLATEKTLDLAASSISALSALTHLQHLDMAHGVNFDPRVLACLSSLTALQLSDIDLGKASPDSLLPDVGPMGAAATMLSVLPCLQQLHVLQLAPGLLPATPPTPAEQYSALTASSKLTFLSLYRCALPPGAADAMFPCSRPPGSLPGLKSVRMSQPPAGHRPCSADILNAPSPFLSGDAASILRAARDSNSSGGGGGGGNGSDGRTRSSGPRGCDGHPFRPDSLKGLVSCCPSLTQLWLTAAVAADADLAPLQQLTGLTELQLGGAVVDDAVAEQLLAGLTQLRRLDLMQCPRYAFCVCVCVYMCARGCWPMQTLSARKHHGH